MGTGKWAMTRILAESGMNPELTCGEVLELLNEVEAVHAQVMTDRTNWCPLCEEAKENLAVLERTIKAVVLDNERLQEENDAVKVTLDEKVAVIKQLLQGHALRRLREAIENESEIHGDVCDCPICKIAREGE